MRILLALDGSGPAERARDLVASLAWPSGSTIRVVSALEEGPALFGGPWIPVVPIDADRYEDEAIGQLDVVLSDAAGRLEAPGVTVETELLRGAPSRVIVSEMGSWQPDVTVLGSRGHGPVGAAFLGSVSAAVVDHAEHPVLVVHQSTRVDRIILAEDGSDAAAEAARIVMTWPVFRDKPVKVVSVVDVAAPWRTGIAPTMFAAAMDVYSEMLANARESYSQAARTTAARLAEAGIEATVELREGDPAGQVCAAADQPEGDLIVLGSRGHTGVSRLVLGSVAHSVLLHAHGSVLIVRRHQHA